MLNGRFSNPFLLKYYNSVGNMEMVADHQQQLMFVNVCFYTGNNYLIVVMQIVVTMVGSMERQTETEIKRERVNPILQNGINEWILSFGTVIAAIQSIDVKEYINEFV